MPDYRRPRVTGATVFFTVTLYDSGSDLLVREIDRLRDAVRATKAERPFEIVAWVVLPDHLHCIWTLPTGDCDFSTRWKNIKTHFTKSVGLSSPRSRSKRAKGEKGIWQRRFWDHHIRDAADHEIHLRYCWSNPVKHGLVQRPGDWPYSSLHRDIRLGRADPHFAATRCDGEFGEPLA